MSGKNVEIQLVLSEREVRQIDRRAERDSMSREDYLRNKATCLDLPLYARLRLEEFAEGSGKNSQFFAGRIILAWLARRVAELKVWQYTKQDFGDEFMDPDLSDKDFSVQYTQSMIRELEEEQELHWIDLEARGEATDEQIFWLYGRGKGRRFWNEQEQRRIENKKRVKEADAKGLIPEEHGHPIEYVCLLLDLHDKGKLDDDEVRAHLSGTHEG